MSNLDEIKLKLEERKKELETFIEKKQEEKDETLISLNNMINESVQKQKQIALLNEKLEDKEGRVKRAEQIITQANQEEDAMKRRALRRTN